MSFTPNILRRDVIGLHAKVVESSNPSCLNIKGKVIDETRNTITILQKKKKKVIIKRSAVLHFVRPDGATVEADGKAIVGRPEDRIKRKIKRMW